VAGFKINIEVAGVETARRILRRVRAAGEDTEPLLKIAGSAIETSILERFDNEHGPGGVPWPKSKRALGLVPNARGKKIAGKTLTDTSDLRDSIKFEVRPGEVEIGSDGLKKPIKAVANQFGTTGSYSNSLVRRHARTINSRFGVPLPDGPQRESVRAHIRAIPPRPFIGIDEDDRRTIRAAWRDHLKGLFQ
jgi:phage gpG-like protein